MMTEPLLEELERYHVRDDIQAAYRAPKGIARELVLELSRSKGEPDWMTEYRLKALEIYFKKPIPTWGPDLSDLNLDDLTYYVKPPVERPARTWDEVPEDFKQAYERLGLSKEEQEFLAGVSTQYDSEIVYTGLKKELEQRGVIFLDTDTALKEYPELFREHFGTVVPASDNKFSALNAAFWSGGTFLYVPKGLKLELPVHAFFRINTEGMAQFERSLIVAEEDAFLHYIEGCAAPFYNTNILHAGVVEVIVKRGAHVRYSSIQNWSKSVYNLVTKRASVDAHGTIEWVDGNLGAKVTMKYPSAILKGEGARVDVLSIGYAGKDQIQDVGTKVLINAPNCTATVVSKSIGKDGGKTNYRGLVAFGANSRGSKAKVDCATLLLDDRSTSDTFPYNEVKNQDVVLEHEASVSKVSEEQLFYFMSRGIPEDEAVKMIVLGFINPVAREMPLVFAQELNKLIELEIEGGLG